MSIKSTLNKFKSKIKQIKSDISKISQIKIKTMKQTTPKTKTLVSHSANLIKKLKEKEKARLTKFKQSTALAKLKSLRKAPKSPRFKKPTTKIVTKKLPRNIRKLRPATWPPKPRIPKVKVPKVEEGYFNRVPKGAKVIPRSRDYPVSYITREGVTMVPVYHKGRFYQYADYSKVGPTKMRKVTFVKGDL